MNMFELDHSAMRGQMSTRKLIVFKHGSKYGNCPAHKLFDLVQIKKKEDVIVPRAYSDYEITVDTDHLPSSVDCEIRE